MGFLSKLNNHRQQKSQYEVTVEVKVQNKKTEVKTMVSARSKKEAQSLGINKVKTQTRLTATACYNHGKVTPILKS